MCFRRETISVTTIYAAKSSTVYTRKKQCKLRHFRDSEKRLPCGIRTGDLRRRSRKNFRFFQKTGANLHPCLAITPIEGNDCAEIFRDFFRLLRTLSCFFSDIRGGESSHVNHPWDSGKVTGIEKKKIFQKTGAIFRLAWQ